MIEILGLFGISVQRIIEVGGILLVAGIIFAESGLLIGFFLPGDTLLFGAGLYASQGEFNLIWLILAVIVAAVVGDNVGYSIGHHTGKRIFKKQDSLLFKHEHIERAEKFYELHGGKTIIMARFIPVVRTFAPVVAGVGRMPRQRFFMFNVVGGILWGAGMPTLGYFVGSKIPHLDQYIELIMLGIVVVSLLLAMGHLFKEPENRRLLIDRLNRFWKKVQR